MLGQGRVLALDPDLALGQDQAWDPDPVQELPEPLSVCRWRYLLRVVLPADICSAGFPVGHVPEFVWSATVPAFDHPIGRAIPVVHTDNRPPH